MRPDCHLIRDASGDILFFPATYRLFRVAGDDGDVLARWLADPSAPAPTGIVADALAAETAKAKEAAAVPAPRGETDSLCLYVAHDCNLACAYCYNHQGRDVHPGRMMEPDVAEAAFRRFFVTAGKRYAVAFYGGEPLLNFRAIKAIVAAGRHLETERDIRIAFSITTNGTVLNREIEDFLVREMYSVTISLDGPPDINDRHRRGAGGGSYERAAACLARLRARGGPRLTVKGTLTRDGVDAYRQSLAHLRQLAVDDAILTPVAGADGSGAELSDADFERYLDQHEALNAAAVERGLSGDDILPEEAVNVVANLLTRRRLRRHCNAGRDLAIAADGAIYACHGLVGQAQFYMGTVDVADATDFRRVSELFAGLDVDRLPTCAACWARYFCGGSCYAHAHATNGTVAEPEPRHCRQVQRCAEAVIRRFLDVAGREAVRKRLYANVRQWVGSSGGAAHA